jgi:hypothetical protein
MGDYIEIVFISLGFVHCHPFVVIYNFRKIAAKNAKKFIILSPAVHRAMDCVHISCLTAKETSRQPQLGDRLMKGLCDQSLSQMGSLSSK